MPIETNILQKQNVPTSINVHTYDYGPSLTQNEVMKIADVHDQGYTGNGILICLMDSGFDKVSTHEVFSTMNIVAAYDFVNNDNDVENGTGQGEGSHGTGTLSLIGGFKEGQLVGTAFGADYILAKTENTVGENQVEEDNWIAAAEWADSIGADIFSTSLGYFDFDGTVYDYTYEDMNGNTAAITIAADLAVGKGIVVFNSAGNNGGNLNYDKINAPADGDSVIAIGAVNASKIRASFSSVGPTYDGRIKPDLMAMGSGTYAAGNGSNSSYRSNFDGTSASCPIAAGVAALMLEKDYSLTPIAIREILKNTAYRTTAPNNLYGWGVIDALAAMNEIPSVVAQLKVNLEGAFDSFNGEMLTELNGLIPLTSPYSEDSRTLQYMPNDIVDWILVELRSTLNSSAITSHSALLHRDGRIVADDGMASTIRLLADPGNYYIVIKHRNHLPIISPNAVLLTKD
ncbi:MAG: S8 family serine peptidase [Ignavibacteriae bacterium]|nr:S8 family serine peptidase [Ignavibacteriota bacterium]